MTILGRTFTKADMRRVLWTALFAAAAVWPTALVLFKSDKKAAVMMVIGAVVPAILSFLKNWWLTDTSTYK